MYRPDVPYLLWSQGYMTFVLIVTGLLSILLLLRFTLRLPRAVLHLLLTYWRGKNPRRLVRFLGWYLFIIAWAVAAAFLVTAMLAPYWHMTGYELRDIDRIELTIIDGEVKTRFEITDPSRIEAVLESLNGSYYHTWNHETPSPRSMRLRFWTAGKLRVESLFVECGTNKNPDTGMVYLETAGWRARLGPLGNPTIVPALNTAVK